MLNLIFNQRRTSMSSAAALRGVRHMRNRDRGKCAPRLTLVLPGTSATTGHGVSRDDNAMLKCLAPQRNPIRSIGARISGMACTCRATGLCLPCRGFAAIERRVRARRAEWATT